ncbi:hypothetical protein V2J09_007403 [Rumex salicifolius]
MAIRMSHMATLSFLLGAVSFVVGVIAENMKPESGTPVQGKDVIICNYPSASHQYVVLGFVSLGFLALSALVGMASLSLSYNKRAIPSSALYASSTMTTFYYIALLWTAFGGAFILWPTLTEFFHQKMNVHKNLVYECGSLLSLSSSLLWLVCLMLAKNARDDYFEEIEEARKGERTQVINLDYHDLPSGQN